jgi:[lysine-biosynthesis-protein LysW]--L-2-aminoadipate ligase
MEFRNSIAPTGVNIPERMVDFCLAVARDGWDVANGFTAAASTRLASISLAEGASV